MIVVGMGLMSTGSVVGGSVLFPGYDSILQEKKKRGGLNGCR